MEIRFENKVAFITGAAGGIGYAAARMFAEAGASVVMADLDSRVTDRAKELEAEGHNAIGIRCDVSDEVQVKAAVEKAVELLLHRQIISFPHLLTDPGKTIVRSCNTIHRAQVPEIRSIQRKT